jgi:hypothetical protein
MKHVTGDRRPGDPPRGAEDALGFCWRSAPEGCKLHASCKVVRCHWCVPMTRPRGASGDLGADHGAEADLAAIPRGRPDVMAGVGQLVRSAERLQIAEESISWLQHGEEYLEVLMIRVYGRLKLRSP